MGSAKRGFSRITVVCQGTYDSFRKWAFDVLAYPAFRCRRRPATYPRTPTRLAYLNADLKDFIKSYERLRRRKLCILLRGAWISRARNSYLRQSKDTLVLLHRKAIATQRRVHALGLHRRPRCALVRRNLHCSSRVPPCHRSIRPGRGPRHGARPSINQHSASLSVSMSPSPRPPTTTLPPCPAPS
jgi:hypothetical protein